MFDNRNNCLQEETNVGFNAVPSVEAFVIDIQNGKWDAVLAQVRNVVFLQFRGRRILNFCFDCAAARASGLEHEGRA